MSKVHYFQRYSQKENWVTNNSLLLLSRLYYHSRIKFENVLNEILGDNNVSLNIGVNFTQQGKGKRSIADGLIAQESFQILIETKLYDNFSIDQLVRHLEGFDPKYETKVLLALSKNEASREIKKEINKIIKSGDFEGVKFASTSFENIIKLIGDSLDDHEAEMIEILDDYSSFCQEQGLIDQSNQIMLAVTAGQSLPENLKYNIYLSTGQNLKFLMSIAHRRFATRAMSGVQGAKRENFKIFSFCPLKIPLASHRQVASKSFVLYTEYLLRPC